MTKPMMKAPAITKRSTKKRLEVDVQFMTYVFGGGVVQGQRDPVTPVRSASVRGQLRYWWRATVGARCESLAAMKKREAEVWGAIWSGEPQHGGVGLTVDCSELKPTAVNDQKGIEYISFPLRTSKAPLWNYGTTPFKVALCYPEDCEVDVTSALSAWLTFGGYGARTTRGFGAVKKVDGPETVFAHPTDLLDALVKMGPVCVKGVPAISSDLTRCKIGPEKNSADIAWRGVVGSMQTFRQGVGVARNHGTARREGRSRWPEADAIRVVTGQHSDHHEPEHAGGVAFPRADFGLPIPFQFINPQHQTGPRDPGKMTLKPGKDLERAPSPLIIRPTSANEPMALWLEGADVPENLYLSGARANRSVTKSVRPGAKLRPREDRLVSPNAIEAFLKYLSY